ncbi:MAG TPA: peptide-methionine (S)-S-oxide reductase MsrA [Candidatus Paceibacterota bacterium]|nr:peptide-methionine (S)-S-oxide reductase MsrA [Candidatus Paceibacterota bacterium]
MQEEAVFAAGCFWGVEAAFRSVPGVIDVESGYTGGRRENPSYEQVCTGATGHAEAVHVLFDSSIVPYESLVQRFFEIHDPTQVNRQGPDVGTQYRSAIFYTSENQREVAERVAQEVAPKYQAPIATEVTPAVAFWRAEEYHQRYAEKHPEAACHI